MTKSQNTKNEQQKQLCITSEQLTEQWKKGELPKGWYYTKKHNDIIEPAYCGEWICRSGNKRMGFDFDEDIVEVLAPVPSYDEWKASYNCMAENEKLKKMATYTPEEWNAMLRQIDRLKELLKECKRTVREN